MIARKPRNNTTSKKDEGWSKSNIVFVYRIQANENGYGIAYTNSNTTYPVWPKLCDLVGSLNKSFAIPDYQSSKGYVFLPGLNKQISITILHKIQDWYIPHMRESTVNQ